MRLVQISITWSYVFLGKGHPKGHNFCTVAITVFFIALVSYNFPIDHFSVINFLKNIHHKYHAMSDFLHLGKRLFKSYGTQVIDWKLWHSSEHFLEVMALVWSKKKLMALKWVLY